MERARWLVRQQAAPGEVRRAAEAAGPAGWQQAFLDLVVRDPETRAWAVAAPYRRRVVQWAVGRAEEAERAGGPPLLDGLAEALGEALGEALAASTHGFSWFSCGLARNVAPLVRVRVRAGGMDRVGLVPWEASFALAEFAASQPARFAGRHVLELGSGTGLGGLALEALCEPASCVLTDFDPDVLENLQASVHANASSRAVVKRLDWRDRAGVASLLAQLDAPPDVVVAADCVYDPDVVPDLVDVVAEFLDASQSAEVLLVSTERNRDTFEKFLRCASKRLGLSIENHTASLPAVPEDPLFHYGPSTVLLAGTPGVFRSAVHLSVVRSARGTVPVRDAALLTPSMFAEVFMQANQPCLIRGIDLGLKEELSRAALTRADPSLLEEEVPVAGSRCPRCNPEGKERISVSLSAFLDCWSTHGPAPGYLKDWHWQRAREKLDGEPPMQVPPHFADDWLNSFCARRDLNGSDFRFLYLGPAGTSTTLHHDVYCSYSWSANIQGVKLWIMLPEGGHESCDGQLHVIDMDQQLLAEWFRADRTEPDSELWAIVLKAFRSPPPIRPRLVLQRAGDAIFVPSGWFHQVHNLEDTLSLNTNWFNRHNLDRVGSFLLRELADTEAALSDVHPDNAAGEDLEWWFSTVQRIMRLNTGIDMTQWREILADRASLEASTDADKAAMESVLEHWARQSGDVLRFAEKGICS